MRIVPLCKEHIPVASSLAAAGHAQERTHVPTLPVREPQHYVPLFERLLRICPGAAALDQSGQLIGYILGIGPIDNFRCTQRGVHVAEWAHAAVGDNRAYIYQHLYEYIADLWVKNGCFAHAISLYAHDELALNTWFRSAFGMICGDAIRELVPVQGHLATDIKIARAGYEHIDLFLPLVHEHQRYYPTSPLFMPLTGLHNKEYFEKWLSDEKHAFWLALDDDQPVGYFESSPAHSGARHLIADPGTASVCSAFVRPDCRKGGVGAALLSRVVRWAAESGYQRLAVDYESHNIYGSRFWTKHFTPVAASLMRIVDERVVWAHSNRRAEDIW